jgi:hypothetical protein
MFCDEFLKQKQTKYYFYSGLGGTEYVEHTKYKVLNLKTVDETTPEKTEESKCFVATAIYGPHSAEAQILQRFRDRFLLKYSIGKSFVSFYYHISPYILQYMEKKGIMRIFIKKIVLDPMLVLILGIVKIIDKRKEC